MSDKEAPEYLVTETSYIGNGIVQEGGKVTYHGLPGSKLEPLNAAARANKKKSDDMREKAGQVVSRTVHEELRPTERVKAPVKQDGDPSGQGAILDDGSPSDPAEPFDPANETLENPVHLPKPAEDTVTPGRAKELTAAQKKAKDAQAKAKAEGKDGGEAAKTGTGSADNEDLT
jgi:hypothetical protein